MATKNTDRAFSSEQQRAAGAPWPDSGQAIRPTSQTKSERGTHPDDGRPGGGQGRVDVTGVVAPEVRVDPNITEGHPGYQESGDSEIIPTGRLAQGASRPGSAVGIASFLFGLLGGIFYWWTPLGMVLSLTGLTLGFVAWLNTAAGTRTRRLAVAGTVLSAATLVLGLVIALLGLELIQLTAYR